MLTWFGVRERREDLMHAQGFCSEPMIETGNKQEADLRGVNQRWGLGRAVVSL